MAKPIMVRARIERSELDLIAARADALAIASTDLIAQALRETLLDVSIMPAAEIAQRFHEQRKTANRKDSDDGGR